MRIHMKVPKRTEQISQQSSGQQTGFVSIIVTMIIMVLLSLIVLGFAKVSRREARQGLDRQLASQARYAAESGINDAQKYLQGSGALGANAATTCNSYAVDAASGNEGLLYGDATIIDNISTTCVLVDTTVTDLVYDGVSTNQEVIIPLKSVNGNIQSLFVSWQGSGATSGYNSANCPALIEKDALVPINDWKCPAGALRVDIVPGGTFSQYGDNAIGVLLYPKVGGPRGPSSAEYPINGRHIWSECADSATSPRACRVTLSSLSPNSEYYLRIRPVYKSADIYVSAGNTDGTNSADWNGPVSPLKLRGAQAMIDSTGRASDVLKRLVARVPACKKGELCGVRSASFAIQSADTICKRYAVIPPNQVKAYNDDDPSCVLPLP